MNRKGFTLVEVLIVVIIIGILASIALPQYLNTMNKARAAEALSQLGSLRSAMERRFTEGTAFGYTTVSALTDLDVDVPSDAKWTYAVTDNNNPPAKSYSITATKIGDATQWVKIDQDGTITRSRNLGGGG